MLTFPEQRYRNLFHALDAENEWNSTISNSQLQYTRRAAQSSQSWFKFLAGEPSSEDCDMSNDDIWQLSAIIRKRLTFAAIDHDYFVHRDDGIMSGDDGGYTNYQHLVEEESFAMNETSGVYRLLGYHGNDLSKLPKPLFAGRVRELLSKIINLCQDADMKNAIMQVVELERRDGYDIVEDCVKAIEGVISMHNTSSQETCVVIERMINDLRREYDEFRKWYHESSARNRKLGCVLGVTLPRISDISKRSYEDRLQYHADCTSIKPQAKRPRGPVFKNGGEKPVDGRSVWEILGPTNAVVKNLGLYERVIKLKKEMCRLQDAKNGIKEEPVEMEIEKPVTEVIEIGDDAEDCVKRERAMGEAGVALLLSHTGFTHADRRALECVTDVFEEYVSKIGRSLVSCRENIDNNAATVAETVGRERRKSREELMMELELILESVDGGFAELYNYVRADMMRTEQALREVEIRLKERVKGLGGGVVVEEEIDGSDHVRECDVVIDGEGMPFGYLGKRVWVDCLDGVKVPPRLVFRDT